MTVNYGLPAHASGIDHEGTLTPDKLFDDFKVRRKITIPAGAGIHLRGTAMGKITASGKWVKSLSAASDGSQVIRGILLHDVDATASDVDAIIGRVGSCNGAAVIFGTGHTVASTFDACLDRGIFFDTVIG